MAHKRCFFDPSVIKKYQLGKLINLADFEINNVNERLQWAPTYESICIMGKNYEAGDVIISKFDHMEPIFGEIYKIYLLGDKVCFFMKNFKTKMYNSHMCAYLVETNDISWYFTHIDSIYVISHCLLVRAEKNTYVASKYL